MSFHAQLTKGFTVVRCSVDHCQSHFWQKAETAKKRLPTECRACYQQRTGFAHALPWRRPLSAEEMHDYQIFSDRTVRTSFISPPDMFGSVLAETIAEAAN